MITLRQQVPFYKNIFSCLSKLRLTGAQKVEHRNFIFRRNSPNFFAPVEMTSVNPISTSTGSNDPKNKEAGSIREKRASGDFEEGKRLAAFTCVDKHVKVRKFLVNYIQ